MRLTTAAALLALASLAGCAGMPDGAPMPNQDGSMTATARADNETEALAGAAAQAGAACRARALEDRIASRETRALGLPARTAEQAEQAAALAHYADATAFPTLAATDDIEARVRFTCVQISTR